MKIKKESKLLSFLQEQCEFGKFQIVEKQDLLGIFDKNLIDENDLENMLSSLERQGYLKVKYEDENVYCLSITRKDFEEKREQKTSLSLFYFLTFVASFLGGMIGAVIVSLL